MRSLFILSLILGALGAVAPPAAGQETPSIQVYANAPGWVTVNWEHSGRGADVFQLQRQQPAYTWVYENNVGSYTDTGLNANTKYNYRVCAVDGAGNATCSPWISVTTLAAPGSTGSGRAAPIITGHDDAPDNITIRWNTPESYGFYNVRWGQKGQTEAQHEVDTSGASGSYGVGGLQPGRVYTFKVQGCHKTLLGSSCGYWSATLEVTTPTPLPPPPTAPVVTVSSPDARLIVLAWSVSPDEKITRTLIERDRSAYSDSPNAIVQLQDGRIRPNTEYQYRVCLFNKVGKACSARLMAIGKPIPPTALANVTFSKGPIPVPSGKVKAAATFRTVVTASWRNTSIPGQFITVERQDQVYRLHQVGPGWTEMERTSAKADPTILVVDLTSETRSPLIKPGNSYRVCAVVPALGAAGKVCSSPTTVP
jgi:titin